MGFAKYLLSALRWLWSILSIGQMFWPVLFQVGIYAGLASAISGLFYAQFRLLETLYYRLNDWGGDYASVIVQFFNSLQNNSYFALASYVFSLDVPFSFFTDCISSYLGVLFGSIFGLASAVVTVSISIISVIWVRKRLKMIIAGFGSKPT